MVQLPSQPRLARARASWELFRDRISRERERLGQLIGAESAPVLPANVTDIRDRRSPRGRLRRSVGLAVSFAAVPGAVHVAASASMIHPVALGFSRSHRAPVGVCCNSFVV